MEPIVEALCPVCGEPTACDVAGTEGWAVVGADCQVCCRPLRFHLLLEEGEAVEVHAEPEG